MDVGFLENKAPLRPLSPLVHHHVPYETATTLPSKTGFSIRYKTHSKFNISKPEIQGSKNLSTRHRNLPNNTDF